MIDYRIESKEGYDDKIGELVWMLEHTRAITMEEIASLSRIELDCIMDKEANTIGALLSHIAAIEFVHQVISFEGRDMTKEEEQKWGTSLELGERAKKEIRNYSFQDYREKLSKVRADTLACLRGKTDEWLFEEHKWDNGVSYNYYYLWYHVMEDEISHRGQIRAIKRQLAGH
ncbi:hypothetical protein CR205_13420 [Alteribacter lacisalsi]|uniref:DUF664 domain-containing protein n=1 Tax=Alteribacter lacisalsi TaxID=2045244 RepID=A0A2W0H4D6_9BACI|nr:DinB family protein [Alteribacter lacisalsi]PYZ96693.1 hypothetical protein CR205_13420 [Alteribacter lacisalsi]